MFKDFESFQFVAQLTDTCKNVPGSADVLWFTPLPKINEGLIWDFSAQLLRALQSSEVLKDESAVFV